MSSRWLPTRQFPPNDLESHLVELRKRDVPVLYLEAVLTYRPHRLQEAEMAHLLSDVREVGALSASTIEDWLAIPSPPIIKDILHDSLRSIKARPVGVAGSSSRICCPVVIGYRSPLCPETRLSGIRWVEVVDRAPGTEIASGFPAHWSRRFEEMWEAAAAAVHPKQPAGRPRWRLLDSLARNPASELFAEASSSLELGASLAAAMWATGLGSDLVAGATGAIDAHMVKRVDELPAKMTGLRRELARLDVFFVHRDNAAECTRYRPAKTEIVPIVTLLEAIIWLQNRSPSLDAVTPSEARALLAPAARRGTMGTTDDDPRTDDLSSDVAARARRETLRVFDDDLKRARAAEDWTQAAVLLAEMAALATSEDRRAMLIAERASVLLRQKDAGGAARACLEALSMQSYNIRACEVAIELLQSATLTDRSELVDAATTAAQAPMIADVLRTRLWGAIACSLLLDNRFSDAADVWEQCRVLDATITIHYAKALSGLHFPLEALSVLEDALRESAAGEVVLDVILTALDILDREFGHQDLFLTEMLWWIDWLIDLYPTHPSTINFILRISSRPQCIDKSLMLRHVLYRCDENESEQWHAAMSELLRYYFEEYDGRKEDIDAARIWVRLADGERTRVGTARGRTYYKKLYFSKYDDFGLCGYLLFQFGAEEDRKEFTDGELVELLDRDPQYADIWEEIANSGIDREIEKELIARGVDSLPIEIVGRFYRSVARRNPWSLESLKLFHSLAANTRMESKARCDALAQVARQISEVCRSAQSADVDVLRGLLNVLASYNSYRCNMWLVSALTDKVPATEQALDVLVRFVDVLTKGPCYYSGADKKTVAWAMELFGREYRSFTQIAEACDPLDDAEHPQWYASPVMNLAWMSIALRRCASITSTSPSHQRTAMALLFRAWLAAPINPKVIEDLVILATKNNTLDEYEKYAFDQIIEPRPTVKSSRVAWKREVQLDAWSITRFDIAMEYEMASMIRLSKQLRGSRLVSWIKKYCRSHKTIEARVNARAQAGKSKIYRDAMTIALWWRIIPHPFEPWWRRWL